jgi:hypothetical protein
LFLFFSLFLLIADGAGTTSYASNKTRFRVAGVADDEFEITGSETGKTSQNTNCSMRIKEALIVHISIKIVYSFKQSEINRQICSNIILSHSSK